MYLSLLLPCIALASATAACPKHLLALTPDHSYCKPPNRQCTIHDRGLTRENIKEIIDTHNRLRSKVAMGNEHGALSDIPSASNMEEMVWDGQLAAVAQKWAEQCDFSHDCNECRQIDSKSVGQNMAMAGGSSKPDWKSRIEGFYKEVSIYADDVRAHRGIATKDGKWIGHFTQVIWAKSSRVGCGYVRFSAGKYENYQIYVCNYSPAGNLPGAPVYQVGSPCTACPKDTKCCSGTCNSNGPDFPGLCKRT